MNELATKSEVGYATSGTSLAKFESLSMNGQVTAGMAHSLYTYDWPQTNTIHHYWPSYSYNHRDTFAQAFKIVALLIDKGYLKNVQLKKFIKIVQEVEEEL